MVKELPTDFKKTLTDALTDRRFTMEQGKEQHVLIDNDFNISFVDVTEQIPNGSQRIGTIGALDENFADFIAGVRLVSGGGAANVPLIYEIDDGLNRAELRQSYPDVRLKRTMIESSFVDKDGMIDYFKARALSENWYSKMIEIAQAALDLQAEP
jgi:hypothetical protein